MRLAGSCMLIHIRGCVCSEAMYKATNQPVPIAKTTDPAGSPDHERGFLHSIQGIQATSKATRTLSEVPSYVVQCHYGSAALAGPMSWGETGNAETLLSPAS